VRCIHCNCLLSSDTLPIHIEDTGEMVYCCEECKHSNYMICRGCGKVYQEATSWPSSNLCSICYNNTHYECYHCESVYPREESRRLVAVRISGSNNNVPRHLCDECLGDYVTCSNCGIYVCIDDRYIDDDGNAYCEHCYDNREHDNEDEEEDCEESDYRDDSDTEEETPVEDINSRAAERLNAVLHSRLRERGEPRPKTFSTDAPTYTECATHLTYGVEVETSAYTRNTDKETGKGCYWENMRDGSLKDTGTEFVSPVLYADQGFEELKKFLDEDISATIDDKCGLHVHIGFPDNISYMNIAKIIKTYQSLEKFFYMTVKSDRINCKYCKPLPMFWKYFVLTKEKDLTGALYIKDSFDIIEKISMGKRGPEYIPKYVQARYSWLNIHSYYIRKTLEIRSHEGTLDYSAITNWINLHGGLMEYVTKTKSSILFKQVKEVKDIDSFLSFVRNAMVGIGMNAEKANEITEYYLVKMKKNSGAITKAFNKNESKILVPINF